MFGVMSKWWIELSGQVVESVLDGTRAVLEVLSPAAGTDQPAAAGPVTRGVIELSARQRGLLESLVKRPTAAQRLVKRARIILGLAAGQSPNQVAKALGIRRQTVYKWRNRWRAAVAHLDEAELPETPDKRLAERLEQVLLDGYRRGKPAIFSPEQFVKIIALACEHPKASGRALSHWTSKTLAAEVIKRGMVKTICRATISRLLKDAKIKPHRNRYWLNACPADPAQFDEQVRQICAIYRQAATLHRQGIHVLCIDEKTGIQALEHKYPAKGVKPGYVARIEHEYQRHGTLCLMANFDVATGTLLAPTIHPTRTEADFLTHLQNTVATDPDGHWILVMDNLNTHQSASLVNWVAQHSGIDDDLGIKGKSGILKSMASRASFLADPSHRIRFVYTPKHTSWLNQVEIWFSILSGRLLKRSSFTSTEQLREELLQFINYFNKTMAKPFKWTYAGKPLTV